MGVQVIWESSTRSQIWGQIWLNRYKWVESGNLLVQWAHRVKHTKHLCQSETYAFLQVKVKADIYILKNVAFLLHLFVLKICLHLIQAYDIQLLKFFIVKKKTNSIGLSLTCYLSINWNYKNGGLVVNMTYVSRDVNITYVSRDVEFVTSPVMGDSGNSRYDKTWGNCFLTSTQYVISI